jgi:pyruvate dehydrogenase E2 component (dihydrolipoamide acetyltransferase)
VVFEFKLPDIGEGVHEGEIVQWLVAEGEVIEEDQDIVEVMTDKATVTITISILQRLLLDNGHNGLD